jgi:hypothetical protein
MESENILVLTNGKENNTHQPNYMGRKKRDYQANGLLFAS